jgi:hypothetical protein
MRVYTCNTCSRIHVEAENVLLHFSTREKLSQYLNYLDSIDVVYFSAINRKKGLSKEIFLQHDKSVTLAFTVLEFEELKQTIREYLTGTTAKKTQFISFDKLLVNLN